MRPTGPLPPKVYWTRRLVLVLAVIVLAGIVWWFVGGSGQANQGTANGAPGGTAGGAPTTAGAGTDGATTSPSRPESTPGTRTRPRQPASTGRQKVRPKASTAPRTPTSTRTPLAQPTGDCKPSAVDLKVDVGDSAPGASNTATLLLTSLDSAACTLSITPDTMVVRVTSGADVVWSSDDCPDALRAQRVVARADRPAAYTFRWNGQRSSQNCQPVSTLPKPGGYWVEAALVGGEPHKAFFAIRAPKR